MEIKIFLECVKLIPAPVPYVLDVLNPPNFDQALLTTDRAESSQGLPVVVYKGIAYGPADLGEHCLSIPDRNALKAAIAAGYTARYDGWGAAASDGPDWPLCTDLGGGRFTY